MIDASQAGEKYKKYSEWLLYGLVAVGCYLSLPFILGAVQGLFLWLTFAAIGFTAWTFVPVFGDLIKNWKMKAIIAIAEANPIETMQNIFIEKSTELKSAEDNIRDFETEFLNVKSMVTDLKKTDPEEAVEFAEMVNKMEEGLEAMRGEHRYATELLNDFEKQIAKARRIWKMSLAMNKALEKSQSAQAEVYGKIKEQVAFDKVRSNLNKAFANLNTTIERRKNSAMFESKAQTALPPADVKVVDLGNVQRQSIKHPVTR
jgi:hypothetical protein